MIGRRRVKGIRPTAVLLLAGGFLLVLLDPEPCRCQMTPSVVVDPAPVRQEAAEPAGDTRPGRLSVLDEHGLKLHLNYTAEAFHGFRVLPDRVTEYRGILELGASLDTGKAGLWPGGELFIKGQNGHGNSFIVNPGDVSFQLSDIGAPDFTQVSEYGLKQDFMEGNVRMILGKQNVNDYFSVNRVGGSFIFPSYTLIPTVPMPTFPAPALGASLFIKPAAKLCLGLGVYDGAPEIGSFGFNGIFDAKGGIFSIVELTRQSERYAPGRYHAHESLGIWYHSGDFMNTQAASGPDTLPGNYGFYLMLDRLIVRETAGGSDDQGLGVFFQFGWAPEDRNPVTAYAGAGLTYTGVFPRRNEDRLGIGLSCASLVGKEPAPGERTHLVNMELFYDTVVNSWMSLQPDIQYYDNPGEGRRNGIAVGLRWIISY